MPFTFSHPALVLPFLGKRHQQLFSVTGLIIGSITPDFESFIKFGGDKVYSHTWPGAFWFDLPMALLLSFVFHLIIRNSLIENLPLSLRARFDTCRTFDWVAHFRQNFIVVLSSLLLGVLSHLLWDAFTHLSLTHPDSIRSTIMLGHRRLFIWLQYASSILGLVAIAVFIYYLPKTKIRRIKYEKGKYWLYQFLIAAVIASFVLTETIWGIEDIDPRYVINVCIASLLCALIMVSFIERVVVRRLKLL